MPIKEAPPALGASGGHWNCRCDGDRSTVTPNEAPAQINFPARAATVTAEFDAKIARALTASGWRVAAALLTLAAQLIEAGDPQSARQQFVTVNQVFRQFREDRAAAASAIERYAELFSLRRFIADNGGDEFQPFPHGIGARTMTVVKACAAALGADVSGHGVTCPGPQHSPLGRSLSVKIAESAGRPASS